MDAQDVVDRLRDAYTVERVFGHPLHEEGVTVIPVPTSGGLITPSVRSRFSLRVLVEPVESSFSGTVLCGAGMFGSRGCCCTGFVGAVVWAAAAFANPAANAAAR